MPFASSSLVQLAYVKEATFGVTPTTGTHKNLRITGESLDFSVSKEASEEINNTRSVSSMIPVDAEATGGVNAEVSYAEYDAFFEAVLQSTFAPYGTNGVGTTFTGTFTATTITAAAAPTGSSAFTTLQPGQFFRVNAPGNANDGKIVRNSFTVAATSTTVTVEASTPLVAAASIAGCTLATSRLSNGTTQSSFTIERQSPDIGEYWAYTGMTPSSMEFSATSAARSTLAFNFMGKSMNRNAGSTNLAGSPTASNTYDIHSGSTGSVCFMWVDGAPLAGTFVQSVNLTYDNTLRAQKAICMLGSVGVGSGNIALTGTLEVYFANGALYDKYKNNENVSFTISTLDNANNGYVFTIPKANLGKVATAAGGKDQDMVLSIEFTGLQDVANANAALRKVMFIDRVGVAVAP